MTTRAAQAAPVAREGMRWIAGGPFLMGSEDFYPEERPVRRVQVGGFWIDAHPVTVSAFRRFVKTTGYVTVAERPLDPADFPGADPVQLVPGSLVFMRSRGPVDCAISGTGGHTFPVPAGTGPRVPAATRTRARGTR